MLGGRRSNEIYWRQATPTIKIHNFPWTTLRHSSVCHFLVHRTTKRNDIMRMMAASLLLLAILLGGSTPVLGQELERIPDDAPDSYVDDVHHCFDPSDDQNLVSCDSTTFRWATDELTPDPPVPCVQDWDAEEDLLVVTSAIINGEIIEVDDQLEPCVLWAMKYILTGSLPTDAPSQNFTGWNTTDGTYFSLVCWASCLSPSIPSNLSLRL